VTDDAEPGEALRRIPLAHGQALVLRSVQPNDVDGLVALYDGLSDDDRYLRFFSLYHPGRPFFERLAAVADRGGYRLVVMLTGEGGDEVRMVAEAGYSLCPSGDGELEITVAEDWRGWLGPYLLDALVQCAAERGVPNLRADVLLTNRAMLAVVRARGYVVSRRPDWSVVSVLIGTSQRPAVWPAGHERARVLVEAPGGRWPAEEEARAAGLDVLTCPGPADDRQRCPVLAGRPCPLATSADAVVVVRPPDDDRWRLLLESHARLHPGVPVYVDLGCERAILPVVQARATRSDT
jgi:hypothetical protein